MIRLIKSILKSCLVPPKFIILVLIDAILFFNFKKKSSKDRVDFKSVNLLTFSRNNGLAYVMEDIGGILSNKFILNYVYLISPAPFVKRILSRLRSMTVSGSGSLRMSLCDGNSLKNLLMKYGCIQNSMPIFLNL